MAGNQAPRFLVVGLDMGDGGLIRRWAREGRLPVLGSLIDKGIWSWLETTAGSLHVSAWPSIYTGAPPGEHGVYYTFQPAPGHQGYVKFGEGLYGRPTMWNLLGRAGRRCTVFDAPYTHAETGSEAAQVFDWGTWARYGRRGSSPARLIRRLDRACGRYPLGFEALDVGLGPLDPDEMRVRLADAARAKAGAAAWLAQQTEWDLFLVVFGETHAAAHYCWDPEAEAGEQPALSAVYEAVDCGIGSLLKAAGPGTATMVVSGDGVGTNRAAWHHLPEVLRRLGYLSEPAMEPEGGEGGPGGASGSKDPIRLLRDALPKDFRKSLARRLPDALRHRLAQRVDMAAIDWSETRAYCLPTDLEGYVRINLEGREPQGIVSPGEEYDRVCDDLAAALGGLADAATGRPAVREVIRADDAFPGARRDRLPDLIVVWDTAGPLETLTSSAVGTVSGPSPDARPGTHAPTAFVLRDGDDGPAVEPGHICDLAPYVLSRFGAPIPDYMGRGFASQPAPGQGEGE